VTLRDKTALGMPLPHRSPDPLALTTVGTVARRVEELGFRELWVTENTVDDLSGGERQAGHTASAQAAPTLQRSGPRSPKSTQPSGRLLCQLSRILNLGAGTDFCLPHL
jgi:hypothetical protein